MKKLFLLLTLLFSISFFAQSEIKITPKKCIPKKGYHLKLKSVFNDSRCPEGTNCVWAGEVSVIVEVYKDKKFVEEKTLTLNSKNREENIQWFSTYYSGKIKSLGVLPTKKEGVVVKPEKQYINVVFEN
ncbi:hypothetical protein [Flavobacterium chungnamense]|uniref:Uncharacterized protein n=1 Tax=Flavobacterium chungnamense TaxID=706182 RepID=A0ABP7UKL8_9FLAO